MSETVPQHITGGSVHIKGFCRKQAEVHPEIRSLGLCLFMFLVDTSLFMLLVSEGLHSFFCLLFEFLVTLLSMAENEDTTKPVVHLFILLSFSTASQI